MLRRDFSRRHAEVPIAQRYIFPARHTYALLRPFTEFITIRPMILCERMIRGLGVFMVILFMLVGFTPISSLVGSQFAVHEAVQPSDAIVVLGAGLIHAGQLREESLRRIMRGMQLYKEGLAPLLIVLGSSSEIDIRSQLAQSIGIPSDAIKKIEVGTTTREEAQRTAQFLETRNKHHIILVTEALHMRRAKVLFERAGLEVSPAVSSDYSRSAFSVGDRLWLSMRFLQEFAALTYYRIAGYI